VNSSQENVEVWENTSIRTSFIQTDHGHTNNPCLGSCLLVIIFFYIQNHTLLTPLANGNILSKPIADQ
jgi:hypothetical protein